MATPHRPPRPPPSAYTTILDRPPPLASVPPLVLSVMPTCCEVEFSKAQHQKQPPLALCVLKRAAMRMSIVLRPASYPQKHGASWLLLEGLGRIYVDRMDGLVQINPWINLSRTGEPGESRLGGEGGFSALVDTGARLCLLGRTEGVPSPHGSPYRGPLLRGADEVTIHFCGAAMHIAAPATTAALKLDMVAHGQQTLAPCSSGVTLDMP